MRSPGFVATIGMFDGVHRGHLHLLGQLRELASARGLEPVVVTFSDHPLSVIAPERTPALLMPFGERVEALGREVARVEILDFADVRQLTAADFMRRLVDAYGVKVLLMGFNHGFGSDRIKDFDVYRRIGAETGLDVVWASESPDLTVSSSLVRWAVSGGDVALAADLLGRPYELVGTVVEGRHLGRTIGFPTANLRLSEPRQLVPAEGVYACRAVTDGAEYPAMVNIGRRPTVDSSEHPERTIEAHIISFDGNLYGRRVRIRLVARLRGERPFGSLEALRAQLVNDRAATVGVLNAQK